MSGQGQNEKINNPIRTTVMSILHHKTAVFNQKALFITLLVVALAVSACQIRQPDPQIEWDTSPQTQLIRVQNLIQFPGILPTYQDERMENYIPEGILYGDGRILWVDYTYGGDFVSRRVMEGNLTEAEIKSLLQQFLETGFFTWKNTYGSTIRNDGPPNESIYVYLDTMTKGVIVNSNPPQGFESLRTLVSTGASAHGQDYLPDQGYLSVYPQYFDEAPNLQVPHWPVTEAGFTLKDLYGDGEFENGIYVDGQVLAFAWQIINRDPRSPLVEDSGEVYLLTLRIPNLSVHQPPDPQKAP